MTSQDMMEHPVTSFDARLQHPFNMIVAGPSQCGKSTFVLNLLKQSERLISCNYDYIVVFSGSTETLFQQLVGTLPNTNIKFVQGLPDDIDEYILPNHAGLFLFDDLQRQASTEDIIGDIFTKRGHHENLSVCLILQNLFHEGKERRTCQRSCHYMILFQNPLDNSITYIIASRLDPVRKKALATLLTSVLRTHRYILIDGKQDTPPQARLRTDIFNNYQRCFYLS